MNKMDRLIVALQDHADRWPRVVVVGNTVMAIKGDYYIKVSGKGIEYRDGEYMVNRPLFAKIIHRSPLGDGLAVINKLVPKTFLPLDESIALDSGRLAIVDKVVKLFNNRGYPLAFYKAPNGMIVVRVATGGIDIEVGMIPLNFPA